MAVYVFEPRPWSPEVVAEVLGEEPLPVGAVGVPAIMCDGAFHDAGTYWLRYRHLRRPVASTTLAHAHRLTLWIRFLREERHRVGPAPWDCDVFVATEEDLLAYYRARQYSPDAVGAVTWKAQLSTIKQFHEWLRRSYQVPTPFTTRTVLLPTGTAVQAIDGLRPRRRPMSSRGTPLTPEYARLLVQGALQVGLDGIQSDALTVDRDAALVSLGLACGARVETLADMTVYEVPAPADRAFVTMRIPDFITKRDAGGDALVFTHHLRAVHNYLEGARRDALAGARRPYQPSDPLVLERADNATWVAQFGQGRVSSTWTETDSATRRRMVHKDGSSPLLWLDPRTGHPISYRTCRLITTNVRRWVIANLEPAFPGRFCTHDLRHTYATHLTVCIFKQALADVVHPSVRDAYAVSRVADAVALAQQCLGHASEESTKLYTRHAHQMLDIDLAEFLGVG